MHPVRTQYLLSGLALMGLGSLLVVSACMSGDFDRETPLSGVGPVGAGGTNGYPDFLGGGAGKAGSGGSSGSSGSGGSGGGPVVCEGMPNVSMRLANTVHGTSINVCFGTDGNFTGATPGSPIAVEFGKMTSVLPVTGACGNVTVKIIDSTKDCSDAGLSSKVFPMGDGTNVTVAYFDSDVADEQINTFNNLPVKADLNRLRGIHGIKGYPSIDLGLYDGVGAITAVFAGIPFGKTHSGVTVLGTDVDSGGYLDQDSVTGAQAVGASNAGDTAAFVHAGADLNLGDSLTAFVVGSKDDGANPPKFMICKDFVEAANLTECTLTAD